MAPFTCHTCGSWPCKWTAQSFDLQVFTNSLTKLVNSALCLYMGVCAVREGVRAVSAASEGTSRETATSPQTHSFSHCLSFLRMFAPNVVGEPRERSSPNRRVICITNAPASAVAGENRMHSPTLNRLSALESAKQSSERHSLQLFLSQMRWMRQLMFVRESVLAVVAFQTFLLLQQKLLNEDIFEIIRFLIPPASDYASTLNILFDAQCCVS